MEKKIIFKTVEPYVHGECADMAPGTIVAQGVCGADENGDADDDYLPWVGPAMRYEPYLPEVVFPEFEFGMAVAEAMSRKLTFDVKCKSATPFDIAATLTGAVANVREEARREVLETMASLLDKRIEEFVGSTDKGGYFLGPFRIVAVLRLPDGSAVALPSPRLLVPNDRGVEIALTSVRTTTDSAVVECTILCQPVLVCWRLRDSGNIPSSGVSVEVYATPPAPVWNKGVSVEFTGSVGSGCTEAGTLDSSGRLIDVSSGRKTVAGAVVSRGWRVPGVSSPVATALQKEMTSWRRIGMLPISDNSDGAWRILYLQSAVSSVFSAKGTSLDFSACRPPVFGWTHSVADRTVSVLTSVRMPSPAPPKGWLPVDYDSEGNECGLHIKEILVRLSGGVVYGASPVSMKVADPDSGRLRQWVYPAPGAREIAMSYVSASGEYKYMRFLMADDSESGSSVSVSSPDWISETDFSTLRDKAVSPDKRPTDTLPVMYDWLSAGLPVCSSAHRQSFGGARLCGVSPVLPRIGNDVYPSLWLMGEDGVRQLRWNASGGWRQVGILTSECCVSPLDVIECGDRTVFRSSDGLRIISGGTVKPVGCPEGRGLNHDIIRNLPGAMAIVGESEERIDREYIYKKGKLAYNSTVDILKISADGQALYFDFGKMAWSASPGRDSSGVSDKGLPVWMLTAPMDFGVRRIRAIRFLGCGLTSELRVAVYASDNLSEWRLVASGFTSRHDIGPFCGSGGRFWRVLTAGQRPEAAVIVL